MPTNTDTDFCRGFDSELKGKKLEKLKRNDCTQLMPYLSMVLHFKCVFKSGYDPKNSIYLIIKCVKKKKVNGKVHMNY